MPVIACCMIVKDAADTLERVIDAVRPFVAEVCVYENGSTDGTLDLLEELNAREGAPIRVQHGEWRDHYGWAYEQAMAMAGEGSDWLLLLDADQELHGGEHLARLIREADPETDALEVFYEYEPGSLHYRFPLVLRKSSGWQWAGSIHDVATLRDGREANLEELPPELVSLHHLRTEPAVHRDIAFLRKRIAATDDPDFDDLGFLGAALVADGDLNEGTARLTEALQGKPWTGNAPYFAFVLATAFHLGGRPDAALAVGAELIARLPAWKDFRQARIAVAAAEGQWDTIGAHFEGYVADRPAVVA
jgi:glycosyltransferase involved in cell wall biosynthesis